MFRKATQPSKQKPTDRVSVTDAGPCRKSLRLHVGFEAIAPVRAAVLGEFQKETTLPGFRKGKAPAELVAKHFAKAVQDETLHRVTKQTFEDAVKTHSLKPVGPFEVSRADYHEGEGLTLEAAVEVEPEFALGDYRGIPLTRTPAEVAPDEVAQALAKLQDSMAQMVPAPAPASGGPGPATEGETKERQVPKLDDELAKDLGFETLDALRTHVEAKLREQKRTTQQQALEASLYNELLKRHRFEVPPRLVSHQTERLTRDFKVRLLLSGTLEAQANEEAAKFTEQLRTNAERHVKLTCILDRIAAKESVTVTQDALVEHLWELARRWQKDPAEVRKLLDTQGLWPSVVSTIRQEQTVAWLLAAAKIENGAALITSANLGEGKSQK